MKEITYELSHLSLKEKNIQEIAFKINAILNQFKIIQYSIDTDIKYRDNINNQLRSLQRDIAELSDRAYGSSRVINQAVTQFSNCERQLQNMLSQLLYTDSQLHKLPNTNIVANKPLKTDTQNWMKRIYNNFISHIAHLKSFFAKRMIGIHNTNIQVSKKTLTDIEKESIQKILKNIPELNSRLQGKPYNNQYIIKEIQKYIGYGGIPIDVTGDLDMDTVTALSMIGISNLNLDNRFAQGDSYQGDGLNLYAYLSNNPIIHVDLTGQGKGGLSNNSFQDWNLYDIDGKLLLEQEELIKDIVNSIDLNELNDVYYNNTNDLSELDNVLGHILSAVQSVTGKESGVIGFIPVEADGALILGVYSNTGHYLDTSGHTLNATNFSILTKSNCEVNIGVRLIIYPFMDSVNDLTGYSFFGGVEFSPGETLGISIDFSGLTPEGLGVSAQVAPPTPSLLPIDVYVGFGYTFSETTLEVTNERWKNKRWYYDWRY